MRPRYRTRIAGTGAYLPERVLTNADLERMVETNDQWIVERTGIQRRHICADDEVTSDLSLFAARKALEAADLTPTDLEMILVATVSGDQVMPSTACVLQEKLGCRRVMSFDITAACSGFVYGLSIADQYIKNGTYQNILVVGAETLHRIVNYKDRDTCILFGDAAGAAIVSRARDTDDADIFSTHMHAEGQLGDLFRLPGGGSKHPLSQYVLDNNMQFVTMKGREIFKNAVRTMSQCCQEALEANQVSSAEVDWLIPHQANRRIIEAVAKHFDFPVEKVIINVHETGNTSAATVPVALDEGIRDGRIKRGQTLLLCAFGAGITSGSVLLRY